MVCLFKDLLEGSRLSIRFKLNDFNLGQVSWRGGHTKDTVGMMVYGVHVQKGREFDRLRQFVEDLPGSFRISLIVSPRCRF